MAAVQSNTESQSPSSTRRSEEIKNNVMMVENLNYQTHTFPNSECGPAERNEAERKAKQNESVSYYHDYENFQEQKTIFINNHEAHQHSPPRTPFRNEDGTVVIEPAHSSSFSKASSNSEGAVPLIKQEPFDSIATDVPTTHKENKQYFIKVDSRRNFESHGQNFVLYEHRDQPVIESSKDSEHSERNIPVTQPSVSDDNPSSFISKFNHASKLWLQQQNIFIIDDVNLTKSLAVNQEDVNSGNKLTSFKSKSLGNDIKMRLLGPNNISQSEGILKSSISGNWELIKSNKEQLESSNSNSEIQSHQEIQGSASWQHNQAPIAHVDVESWLTTPLQKNSETSITMDNYIENYEGHHSPTISNSDLWKKKREMDAHRAWEEQCQEIKQAEMTYSLLKENNNDEDKTMDICQDSDINKIDANIALHSAQNHYAYSVIQDPKLWHQTSENTASTYVLMDSIQSKLLTSKSSISETGGHMEPAWDENKNKTTDSQPWLLDNAHLNSDMAAGDPWVYQTVSSGPGQPIRERTDDTEPRLQSENNSHSVPSTPPSREGLSPRPAQMAQAIAPSAGERDQATAAGTSSASDSVMVSTFGSMAPYSMAGNYSSPSSYSGRDLYPGKPSSGYDPSSPSSATLYASPTSGLIHQLPYVTGQSMGGHHQSMVSQGGHHWSGSQAPSVHDHQQSTGGYGISALTSGLNLAQNSLNLSTSQSGGDQGELNRTAGFTTFAASGHGYLRPDMAAHWGILDPTISGLQHTYCPDGIPPHLGQGKFLYF